MNTPYWELHITIEKTSPVTRARLEALKWTTKASWKVSNITDDILLGPGPKLYLTSCLPCDRHRMREVKQFLEDAVDELINQSFNVLRWKIECVVFDVRKDA